MTRTRGPAGPDEAGRLPGDGIAPLGWTTFQPDEPVDRKNLRSALLWMLAPVPLAFAHPILGLIGVGMLPVVLSLARNVRKERRGVSRISVDPGLAREVQLHRVNGEFITRSLDELTELRPLVVGLRSADSGAERVLEIRFGDERYRTSSRYATEDNDVWRLRDALRRSCPQARTLPLQDTSRWVSDVI